MSFIRLKKLASQHPIDQDVRRQYNISSGTQEGIYNSFVEWANIEDPTKAASFFNRLLLSEKACMIAGNDFIVLMKHCDKIPQQSKQYLLSTFENKHNEFYTKIFAPLLKDPRITGIERPSALQQEGKDEKKNTSEAPKKSGH